MLTGASDGKGLAATRTERHRMMCEKWGRDVINGVERQITLAQIDRVWCEHLAYTADLREGIHLLSVMRLDPLAEFQRKIIDAYDKCRHEMDEAIAATFEDAEIGPDGIDLQREGLQTPASTWTYVVSDDPFRNQLYAKLGGTTMGLGIIANFPLVLAWKIFERWQRKKRERRLRHRIP